MIDNCLRYIKSRFELVILASHRTKQILGGAQPLAQYTSEKPMVVSLMEISEGRIDIDSLYDSAIAEISADLKRKEYECDPEILMSFDDQHLSGEDLFLMHEEIIDTPSESSSDNIDETF